MRRICRHVTSSGIIVFLKKTSHFDGKTQSHVSMPMTRFNAGKSDFYGIAYVWRTWRPKIVINAPRFVTLHVSFGTLLCPRATKSFLFYSPFYYCGFCNRWPFLYAYTYTSPWNFYEIGFSLRTLYRASQYISVVLVKPFLFGNFSLLLCM